MRQIRIKKKLLVLGMSLMLILGTVITVNATDDSECRHVYENGICTKCEEFETPCDFIGVNEYEYFIEANIDYNSNGPLTWNTYKFYDEYNKEVAMLEILNGYYYSKSWLTVDGITAETSAVCVRFNEYDGTYISVENSGAWSLESDLGVDNIESCALISSEIIPEMNVELEAIWDEASKPGVVMWNNIDNENMDLYIVRLLYEGVCTTIYTVDSGEECKCDLSGHINESGVYTVQVIAVLGKNLGAKVVCSEEFVYEKPNNELGTVEKVWWTASEGDEYPTILNWLQVPGADGYRVTTWVWQEDMATRAIDMSYDYDNELVMSLDLSERIKNPELDERWGEFVYCTCEIKALSGDITVIANASSIYETTEEDYILLELVEEEIMNNIEASTEDTIIDDINNIGIDIMADAMQNNTEILDKIEEIEKEFVEKNNVEILAPIVAHSELEDTANIKIVGTGFNATAMATATGSAICVEFSEVDKEDEKQINEKLYKNAVQINIVLKENDEIFEGDIKAPVTITMQPPRGVELKKLVILYYNAGGEAKLIYPNVNEDGTVKFSITDFDTYVFANIATLGESTDDETVTPDNPVVPDEPVIPDNPNDDEDDDEDYYDDYYDDVVIPGSALDAANREYVQTFWNGKKGWQTIADKDYCFDEYGQLQLGWIQGADDKWYYTNNDGSKATKWVCSDSSRWYYMDTTDGQMITNTWICDEESNRWYYLGADGAMCSGWNFTEGKWYYLDKNGAMCSGWNFIEGYWYLMDNSGAMLIGWQNVGGKEYYLDENGKCLLDTTTPDGSKVDSTGAKIK